MEEVEVEEEAVEVEFEDEVEDEDGRREREASITRRSHTHTCHLVCGPSCFLPLWAVRGGAYCRCVIYEKAEFVRGDD